MDIIDTLKKDVAVLAQSSFKDFHKEAIADGKSFVDAIGSDLVIWAASCAAGKMTKDELSSLIKGKKDLAEMKALKQRGLAKARIDQFVNGVIDKTISRTFGI